MFRHHQIIGNYTEVLFFAGRFSSKHRVVYVIYGVNVSLPNMHDFVFVNVKLSLPTMSLVFKCRQIMLQCNAVIIVTNSSIMISLVSFANFKMVVVMLQSKSLMKIIKNTGTKTDP